MKPAAGARAVVTVKPRPANVLVVNDVLMGGGCSAWARWKTADEIESGPPLQLWVRGRWKPIAPATTSPGSRRRPSSASSPSSAPRRRADRRAAHGRRALGRRRRHAARPRRRARRSRRRARTRRAGRASCSTPVGEVLREMNKTSNNEAARNVLLSLAPGGRERRRRRPQVAHLKAAQERMRGWLRTQGLPTATSRSSSARASREPSAASRARSSSCCAPPGAAPTRRRWSTRCRSPASTAR